MPKPKSKPEGLYNKYTILDAKTGKVKRGKYFVLRLDTDSTDERACVIAALTAYSKQAQFLGMCFENQTYKKLAVDIAQLISETRDEWIKK